MLRRPSCLILTVSDSLLDFSRLEKFQFSGTIIDDDKLLEFSDIGGYCQYDFFGLECSHFQMNLKVDHLSDAQRIGKLKLLRDHGKLNRILMSHDIHTKHRLVGSIKDRMIK